MMYTVAILTASDRGAAGIRAGLSGPAIKKICTENGFEVVDYALVPDEQAVICQRLQTWCDNQTCDLILTTGGTGLAARDVTPEATLAVADKIVPGIAEALRNFSLQITKRAMLSRGVAVISGQTLIINLPGSVKAVEESLTYLLDQLPHALGILTDRNQEAEKH